MTQVLTVSCKLRPTPEQAAKIDATLAGFADACSWVNGQVPPGQTNALRMQAQHYHQARALFGLSANLTQQAFRRVASNRKTALCKGRPVKGFAPTSLQYDQRIFSFDEKTWAVSLTLLGGRERIPIVVGDYQRHLLKGQKPTSATLVRRKDGSHCIQIQVESVPPEPLEPDGCLGVDLGRTDIAHTSRGEHFCGQQLKQVRDKHARVRASLQSKAAKGTRSTRRRSRELQKRLSGRERRFQTHTNHTIGCRLVRQAKALNWSIALEDLTGMRERTNTRPRSKAERRRSNGWAFHQLRRFLEYKAVRAGVSLVLVNPAYTSKACHRCHRIGERQGKRFACADGCGWRGDADFNGAVNISQLGASVTCPRGPWMACHLEGFRNFPAGLESPPCSGSAA
jgi:IS605 OrfB family transposase